MVQDVFSLLRPNDARRPKASFTGLSSLLSTSQPPEQRTAPIGTELQQLIEALAQSGRELHRAADSALAPHIKEVLDRIAAISCRVAVVGQVKAGKSSFINALMQRGKLLPTHVNPWTAVATRLHFGTPGKPVTGCDFTFFTEEEWAGLGTQADGEPATGLEDGFAEMKRRAELRVGEQFHHLLGKSHYYQSVQAEILQNYLCAGPPVDEISREIKPGRYADITKTANVYFPLPPLAVPAILIDTPGTNDSTHLRHRITREIIEGADIYIVVLTARQPLASSDLGLLKLLRGLEKKRIVVFINRVDELSERAGATEVVVNHVRDELQRVFGDASIPVVAGSAKWAGLAAREDDVETLRREAATPAFRAIAAQKSLAIPAADGSEDEAARLQDCFRSASGLDSVTRLLSLFMLAGFVANHAKGVAEVLLSAADAAAMTGRRELRAVAAELAGLRDELTRRHGAAGLDTALAQLDALLKVVGDGVETVRADTAPAIRDGLVRLETALDAHIRALADQRAMAQGQPAYEAKKAEAASPRARPEDDPRASEGRPDWLTSVKEAAFDFLRKVVDTPPPEEAGAKPAAPKPLGARPTSLTVPVTARPREVAMETGSALWTDWIAHQQLDAKRGEELSRIVQQEFAPLDDAGSAEAGRERMRDLEGAAKRLGLRSIAPLTQLAALFRALQRGEAAHSEDEQRALAQFVAEHDRTIAEACLAIAIHEKVTQQIKTLFTPPRTAN